MSNIFDLFGATSTNLPRNQSKRDTVGSVVHSAKSRTFSNNGNLSLEGAQTNAVSKPKGLSLRPQSDPNIRQTNSEQVTEKSIASKPSLKNVGSYSNPDSTVLRNTNEKLGKAVRGPLRKVLSPISKSPHSKFTSLKQTGEFVFKRPNTPRQTKKKTIVYPEPEKLANYYNEKEYDRLSWEELSLDEEFRNLMIPRTCVTPFEDEGFISDPETLCVPPLSPINCPGPDVNDFGDIKIAIPAIPVIPKDNDDF